jgi:hypothetical protein
MRELAGLLGACQAPSAEALLVELLRSTDPSLSWYHDLVAAVAAYRSATATAALFEVLDAALSPATNAAAGRAGDVLVQELGQLGREDPNVLSLLHARVREAVDADPCCRSKPIGSRPDARVMSCATRSALAQCRWYPRGPWFSPQVGRYPRDSRLVQSSWLGDAAESIAGPPPLSVTNPDAVATVGLLLIQVTV